MQFRAGGGGAGHSMQSLGAVRSRTSKASAVCCCHASCSVKAVL